MSTSIKSSEIYPYIHQITLPLPGNKPGPVNSYLFIGDRITLLDGGTSRHAPRLIEAVESLGVRIEDIDQLIFTHGHIDHFGAADEIIKKAGDKKPQVIAHGGDLHFIQGVGGISKKQGTAFSRLMDTPLIYRWGFRVLDMVFSSMAKHCEVDRIVQDGDEIILGSYPARIISTPGHSKGSICLWLQNERVLFTGDTVLPHITPNAFVMLQDDRLIPERLSQDEFYQSLAKIESLRPDLVFPGHGKTIEDLQEVLNMYREGYTARDGAILEIIKEGEFTVYEIARELFPQIGNGKHKILEIYLAISEVFTHLQVLQKKGEVCWQVRRKRLIVRRNK